MTNIHDIIVVEFYVKQQAFHKETLHEMLKNNIQNIISKKEIDYLPIGVFDNNESADNFIKITYDTFKKSETDLQQDAAINYFN